ncbi:MAG: prevent-host-death family protein [Candidatus Latescibacterota bacterium]|jgi:prevent-host-death family protein
MQIPAGEFKSKCLKLMDQVRDTHEEIVITKHGKPVVKVIPIEEEKPRPLLGYLQGSVSIDGDITAPIDEVWEADDE